MDCFLFTRGGSVSLSLNLPNVIFCPPSLSVDMGENKESLYITSVSHINIMHIKMTFIMNI